MKTTTRDRRRGSATIELALLFVPLFFTFIASIEVSRAMWTYHTFTSAVKKASRVAAVHGARCVEASAACPASIAAVAQVVRDWAIGLDVNQIGVTFTAGGQSRHCASLSQCLTDGSRWPDSPGNAVGLPITIDATYPFYSAVSVFWPGGLPAAFQLRAHSLETIQF